MEKIIVDEENIRLDSYIAKKRKDLSRTMIQKLIEDGDVLVNGLTKKISYKVNFNDEISLNVPEPEKTD